jgi:hypothetical protein
MAVRKGATVFIWPVRCWPLFLHTATTIWCGWMAIHLYSWASWLTVSGVYLQQPANKVSLPVDDCQAFPIYRTGYPLRKKESVQYPATILQRSVRWQLKSHPLAVVVERFPVQSVCQRSPSITFWWCGYYQHNTYTQLFPCIEVANSVWKIESRAAFYLVGFGWGSQPLRVQEISISSKHLFLHSYLLIYRIKSMCKYTLTPHN